MKRHVFADMADFASQNAMLSTPLPYSEHLSCLQAPLQVGTRNVPNRLVCQAMEGCDGTSDGAPDVLTRRRYLRLAKGGAGLIWFEATACLPEGRANPRQLWLTEQNKDAFARLLEDIRQTCLQENGYVPLIIMQDTHSGRYSKPQGVPAPLIAYNNPLFEQHAPIAPSCIVSDAYLDRVKDALVHSAALAAEVGFDGVDIKCCHRYLNSELLSAFTREGRYGGSFDNRTRLLRESVQGAMQVCPRDFLVSTRLNAYDGFAHPYGFGMKQDGSQDVDLTEPKRLLAILQDMGMPLINITMGNPYVNPHVNRPFAKGGYEAQEHPLTGVCRVLEGTAELQRACPHLPIICSALSYLGVASPHVAAAYIQKGGFAMAGYGRTIFANPDFAKQILQQGGLDKSKLCLACSQCTELMRAGSTPGCVIRDDYYRELYRRHMASR